MPSTSRDGRRQPGRAFSLRAAVLAALAALAACALPPPASAPSPAPQVSPRLSLPPSDSLTPAATRADTPPLPAVRSVIKVGLLLPLTGRNAELGRALQDAATLSLFDKYARLTVNHLATRVELLPKDTGDAPEIARASMQQALDEGASLIIGPLYADAAEAAAPLARARHVPVISFSNSRSRAGDGLYLIGFSPGEQAARVVRYAISRDKRALAVLVPKSPLGDEVLASAKAAANQAGAPLVAQAQYATQGIGLESAMQALLPSGREPNFNALLLAESGTTLESILRALSARGVSMQNVQLLGTGMWDDKALLQRVNLDKAWLATSAPEVTAQFESRFQATYHYTPPRIASLAYDAVALAVTLATSGRGFTAESLTNPAGFQGPANGLFRFTAEGAPQRGLAVVEVHGSELKTIAPAPTRFSGR